jgi:hypothetical protein
MKSRIQKTASTITHAFVSGLKILTVRNGWAGILPEVSSIIPTIVGRLSLPHKRSIPVSKKLEAVQMHEMDCRVIGPCRVWLRAD